MIGSEINSKPPSKSSTQYREMNLALSGEVARRCGMDQTKMDNLLRCLKLRIDSKAAHRFFISLRTHTPLAISMAVHRFLHRDSIGDISEGWSPTMRVKVFMSDVLKEDRDIVEMAEEATEVNVDSFSFAGMTVPQSEVNVINEEADYERKRWNWDDEI